MTTEERERLMHLKTLGTMSRDQVADYVALLKKEEEIVVEVEPIEEPVKKTSKRKK
jgi:hypothetical protein